MMVDQKHGIRNSLRAHVLIYKEITESTLVMLVFETSKSMPSDTLLPTKTHLLILLK